MLQSKIANTAFIMPECIVEAADLAISLYITMLDAIKAFDIVSHPALLESMYNHRVDGRAIDEELVLWHDFTDQMGWHVVPACQ